MLLQDFSLSIRNLFHIVGPLTPIARQVNFKLKSHILMYHKILLDICDLLTKLHQCILSHAWPMYGWPCKTDPRFLNFNI